VIFKDFPTRIVLSGFAVIGIAVSFIFEANTIQGMNLCWFKALTDLPCPGCGLTRGVCSISHGDLSGAFVYNPFVYVIYPCLYLVAVYPVFYYFSNEKIRNISDILMSYFTIIVILLMTAYNFTRW